MFVQLRGERAQLQLSDQKLREWQRYRGWTIKILTELEHSGGMTSREISTRIGYPCHSTSVTLCRMLNTGLVDKVERWGWQISRDGLFLLSLFYVNTTSTQHQHNINTTSTLEFPLDAPTCFSASTCHIKHICKDKRYTAKNAVLCELCVWNTPEVWNKGTVPVEKVKGGATEDKPEMECSTNA